MLEERKGFLIFGGALLLSLFVLPVMAAEFPTKPVTLICPWAPGGSTDVTMRVLAETTGKYLGQPVVVENKAGGGGTVGGRPWPLRQNPTAIRFPDPHLRHPLSLHNEGELGHAERFHLHHPLTGYTFGVVVKADAPWKTWDEFVAYAKANPGKVTYATPGAGTSLHITMENIAMRRGIKWIQVPMKGGGETTPAVLGGHVTATADSTGWAPQVDAGQLRLLVTWGNQRTKKWPNVPTLKELGYGIVSNSPFGIAGPKGMDPKVVKILHDAFKKGTEDPGYEKALANFDMEPFYKNSEDYTKFIKEQ